MISEKKTNGDGYDSYYHTTQGQNYTTDITSIGLRAYWKPDETGSIPEVQLGIDWADIDGASTGEADATSGWLIGLGWKDLTEDPVALQASLVALLKTEADQAALPGEVVQRLAGVAG